MYNYVFLIRWINNFGGFFWILIGWFVELSVQTFQPLILFYRRSNFVCHHWGCISICRPLSYPFRFLAITPSLQDDILSLQLKKVPMYYFILLHIWYFNVFCYGVFCSKLHGSIYATTARTLEVRRRWGLLLSQKTSETDPKKIIGRPHATVRGWLTNCFVWNFIQNTMD